MMLDTIGHAYSALVTAQARCNDLYESGASARDILAAQGELKTARDEWRRVAGYTCARQMHAECPCCDCACHTEGEASDA